MAIEIEWRGGFENGELNALHAEGFGHPVGDEDWRGQMNGHSFGWVCARRGSQLVGFANVAWDGGGHAFLLDVVVAESCRGLGLGRALVEEVVRQARAAGLEWLHVDFEPGLGRFYLEACGFRSSEAGVMNLS